MTPGEVLRAVRYLVGEHGPELLLPPLLFEAVADSSGEPWSDAK